MERREFLKKGLALTGSAVIGGGLGGIIYEGIQDAAKSDEEKLEELREELQDIKEEQETNLIGDCVNENVIRKALGAPPASIQDCVKERKTWRDMLLFKGKNT